jgi:hypothetical protein
MKIAIIIGSIIVASNALMAEERKPGRSCGSAAAVRKAIANAGEEPILRGLASTGEVFEVWASVGGKTWTATATTAKGVLCVLGIGRNAETREPKEGAPA